MPSEPRRDVFQALADPTRRSIIGYLAETPRPVSAIAGRFSISRQAVSQQLHFLAECGLVEMEARGRERVCRLRSERLADVDAWLQTVRALWEVRFDQLDRVLEAAPLPSPHQPLYPAEP